MIDTHIHLDEEAYASDREEMILRQRESGVEAMLIPGVNASSVGPILDLSAAFTGLCYPALGFHPQEVKEDWKAQWTLIEAAIREHRDKLVAIGEIGLDYYWDTTFKAEQQELLRLQLALAQELNLPVMIHNREATEDTLCILREAQMAHGTSPNGKLTGVIHCFNGHAIIRYFVVLKSFVDPICKAGITKKYDSTQDDQSSQDIEKFFHCNVLPLRYSGSS